MLPLRHCNLSCMYMFHTYKFQVTCNSYIYGRVDLKWICCFCFNMLLVISLVAWSSSTGRMCMWCVYMATLPAVHVVHSRGPLANQTTAVLYKLPFAIVWS